MATSDKGLLQRQKEVIQMQDNMLVDIEKGVDRLQIQVSNLLNMTFLNTDRRLH
jgi:hypothetical protein